MSAKKGTPFTAHAIASATVLHGADYAPVVMQAASRARRRFWASVFLIDVRRSYDTRRRVRGLLQRLSYAQWRNIEVRVMVGLSPIRDLYAASVSAYHYMRSLGINARVYGAPGKTLTHSKYLVIDDDTVVVGSNNWTDDAFSKDIENSLLMVSPDMNYSLSREFAACWETSTELAP